MKIQIKNYRTLQDTSITIHKNKINYVLGSNESGKTNLLNALRIPVIKQHKDLEITPKDKTKVDGVSVKDNIEVIVSEKDAINVFKVEGSSWFFTKSPARDNYEKYITENISQNKEEIINIINGKYSNSEITEDDKDEALELLETLCKMSFISKDERKTLLGLLDDKYKKIILGIDTLLSSMMINYPKINYVEPIMKAKQVDKIVYPYSSLFSEQSTLRNICEKFLNDEQKENITKLTEQFEDEDEISSYKWKLFDALNEQVKKYFEDFDHIRAYPKFRPEESRVLLDVISKDNWKIDSGDENERSLGYKSFLRILTELIATESSKQEIIYIIDEPEQSLHPYLQSELIEAMNSVIKSNQKLTIVLVTHSPYMIKNFEDNNIINSTSFIYRNDEGASIVEDLSDINNLMNIWEISHKENRKIEGYLFKILRDSDAWQKKENEVNDSIESLQTQLNNNEISANEFLQKIAGYWEFDSKK